MKIKEGFVLRETAGSYIVMNLGSEISFNGVITLNETGAFIWKAIEDGKSEGDIAKAIAEEYEVDYESALSDASNFIAKMSKAGILE